MNLRKAADVFEKLEHSGFSVFTSFGKMSIAAVFENRVKNSFHIKIIFKKRNPIYIIDTFKNEIVIYTETSPRDGLIDDLLKNKTLNIGQTKFRLDVNGPDKIEYLRETLDDAELLYHTNPCNEDQLPYNHLHNLIEGGIDIGAAGAINSGTLGGLFYDFHNNIYGITNAHVLKRQTTTNERDYVLQPGGEGSVTPNMKKKIGLVIESTRELRPYQDFIVFKVLNKYKDQCVNSTRFKTINFIAFGRAVFKEKVYKAGRSSNLTQGKVLSTTCCTFYNNKIIFKDQILLSCMAIPGDSGSLVVNSQHEVLGLIHSKIQSAYTLASKAKYMQKALIRNNINFKQFINTKTRTMIKKVKVKFGSTEEHQLLGRILQDENREDVLYEIEGCFGDWKDSVATSLKITDNHFENTNDKAYIFDARFVNIEHCSSNDKCRELQLLATSDSSRKKTDLEINCEFKMDNINVVLIKFTEDEYTGGLHKTPVCSDCYEQSILLEKEKEELVQMILNEDLDQTPIPTKKKGNILRGIRP
jgi:hypothetical protein